MIEKLRKIVEDPRTERAVMALILINAVILGMETYPRVMDAIGPLLDIA